MLLGFEALNLKFCDLKLWKLTLSSYLWNLYHFICTCLTIVALIYQSSVHGFSSHYAISLLSLYFCLFLCSRPGRAWRRAAENAGAAFNFSIWHSASFIFNSLFFLHLCFNQVSLISVFYRTSYFLFIHILCLLHRVGPEAAVHVLDDDGGEVLHNNMIYTII